MKISYDWLQSVFAEELPGIEKVGEALTLHAFEIEDIEDADVLDVKVTPNRGHDCLCHRGISKELSAILKIPLKVDPFGVEPDLEPRTDAVSVSLQTELCNRYIACYIKNIKVGPSPDWLRNRMASMGQRSINNVVDATNFIMFNLGQPLHAFDAKKLQQKDGNYAITVREARKGEMLLALDEKEYALDESMLVITDGHAEVPIGIAGIKGGMPAGITEETTDIIIESANFDGATTRKTAQKLKLRTDASQRFEQVMSPEVAAHGMAAIKNLISNLAGGELQGYVDVYPKPQERKRVAVSLGQVQQVLGSTFTEVDIHDAFSRLAFVFTKEGDVFTVEVPFERLDIALPEDLIEEVGRIEGYEKVPATVLPHLKSSIEVPKDFYVHEYIRDFLVSRGFSEVFTSVFADTGERIVLNKVDGVKPYLRTSLSDDLAEALERNVRNKELLGLKQVKLFEIGTVWKGGKEEITYELAVEPVKGEKTKEEYAKELQTALKALPKEPGVLVLPRLADVRFKPFSKYPFIVRDIAMWVPAGVAEYEIGQAILTEAGELCVKISLFDRFEKDGKISLGYRLIFQSFDHTLTDDEANKAMERVYTKMKERGFEIR